RAQSDPVSPTRRSSDLMMPPCTYRLVGTKSSTSDAARVWRSKRPRRRRGAGRTRSSARVEAQHRGRLAHGDVVDHAQRARKLVRSEEHTSELQSRENLV